MIMSALSQLLCLCFVVVIGTINAQNEERFYFFDFLETSSDWIENIGSFDPNLGHTYTPVNWRDGSTRCPRVAAGEAGVSSDAGYCLEMCNDAFISRQISTLGFHSIRLQIDVKADSVEIVDNEWCVLQYRTASTNWVNVNIVQGDSYALDFNIMIPDTTTYNDQPTFEVKVAIVAQTGGDSCYFDDLEIFGIPQTVTTRMPTREPSRRPSKQPSGSPSRRPSSRPSRLPSGSPTGLPSERPSEGPSAPPSGTPSVPPSGIPSVPPSGSPTRPPSGSPTGLPSVPPSGSPTEPSIPPTGHATSPTYNMHASPNMSPKQSPTETHTLPTIIGSTQNNGKYGANNIASNNNNLSTFLMVLFIVIIVVVLFCICFVGCLWFRHINIAKRMDKNVDHMNKAQKSDKTIINDTPDMDGMTTTVAHGHGANIGANGEPQIRMGENNDGEDSMRTISDDDSDGDSMYQHDAVAGSTGGTGGTTGGEKVDTGCNTNGDTTTTGAAGEKVDTTVYNNAVELQAAFDWKSAGYVG